MELASSDIRFDVPLADACYEDRRSYCAAVPPGATFGAAGVTAIDTSAPGVTVIEAVAVLPDARLVAVMVAAPALTPVTTPDALTVATEVADDPKVVPEAVTS